MARMIIWLVVVATMLLFSHRQVGLAARPQGARGALAVTQEQQRELSLGRMRFASWMWPHRSSLPRFI